MQTAKIANKLPKDGLFKTLCVGMGSSQIRFTETFNVFLLTFLDRLLKVLRQDKIR